MLTKTLVSVNERLRYSIDKTSLPVPTAELEYASAKGAVR